MMTKHVSQCCHYRWLHLLKSKTCVLVTLLQMLVFWFVWTAVSLKQLCFLCVVKDSAVLEDERLMCKLTYLYIM